MFSKVFMNTYDHKSIFLGHLNAHSNCCKKYPFHQVLGLLLYQFFISLVIRWQIKLLSCNCIHKINISIFGKESNYFQHSTRRSRFKLREFTKIRTQTSYNYLNPQKIRSVDSNMNLI